MPQPTPSTQDSISLADLTTDRVAIQGLLRQEFGPDMDDRRYDWLYATGPAGPAKVWKYVSPGGELIGLAGAFPRILQRQTDKASGFVLGDFCIRSDKRTLGPALKLQKACMAGVAGTPSYDLPSDSMYAVYQRIGNVQATQTVRWARPLRSGNQVRSRIPVPLVADAASAVVDFGLRLSLPKPPAGVDVGTHQADFGPEFTELADRTGTKWGSCGYRSGEYLNWRYKQHPHLQFDVQAAQRNGTLVAYSVTIREEQNTRIVDLFGSDELGLRAAVTKVISDALHTGQATVSFSIPESHGWSGLLRDLGFHPRESRPLVLMGTDAGESWLITDGDRES